MQPDKREIGALTGVRALAAIWVVLFHIQAELTATFPGAQAFIEAAFASGYLGVDLFFILSGFIISYNYADWFATASPRRYATFLWARLARIYPVHLFTLALMLIFVVTRQDVFDLAVRMPERFTLDLLFENLALVQAWALPIDTSWNVPAWSISAEWAGYLLFPIFVALVGVLRRPVTMLVAIPLLILVPALVYLATDYPGTMAYGLPRFAAEFTVGCLLFRLYRLQIWRAAPWGAIGLGAFALTVVLGGVSARLGLEPFTWAPLALATLVYGLAWEHGAFSAVLRRPWALYWGTVSYSLYMVHGMVLSMFRHYFTPTVFAASDLSVRIFLVTMLVAAIALLAAATYHWVERPSRALMRRHGPLSLARPLAKPVSG